MACGPVPSSRGLGGPGALASRHGPPGQRPPPAPGARPPRRRVDRHRGHHRPVRRGGCPGHPGHLHAGRARRGHPPRAGPPGRGWRPPRGAPDHRTGRRVCRAGHPRPAVSRWPRPVARLGDDGPARQRQPGLLLAGRPGHGRGRAGPGHPGGPPAGAGHLRQTRLLRPPRSHPGTPGEHGSDRRGGQPGTGPAMAGRQVLRHRDAAVGGRGAGPAPGPGCPTTR